jgi:hypothetical protein
MASATIARGFETYRFDRTDGKVYTGSVVTVGPLG